MGFLRSFIRLIAFLVFSACCCLHFLFTMWMTGRSRDTRKRAVWCQFWASTLLKLLGVRVTVHGSFPTQGLMVSNHLSYLDIIVYASCQPFIFVSKSEVKRWPIIGIMTQCAGTLFINRAERGDVKRMAEAFAPVIERGNVITLFPEGTSTGGDRVLPFFSSLFEPAAVHGWSVSPSWIGYVVPGGDASEEVAYWKDMTFFPHLLHLFGLQEIRAIVRPGVAAPPGLNRKQMAKRMHEQVCQLAYDEGRSLVVPPPGLSTASIPRS